MADGPSIKELFGSDSDEEDEQVDVQVRISYDLQGSSCIDNLLQPWEPLSSVAPHYLRHCQ